MPKLMLTDAAIRKLKTGTRLEFWDTHTVGLGLRVTEKGTKSWVMLVRVLVGGKAKQKRITFGPYPAISLKEARDLAEKARIRAQQGRDPADVVRESRAAQIKASSDTFETVRARFLPLYRTKQKRKPAPRTLAEIDRVLSGKIFKSIHTKPLSEITRDDIQRPLDDLVAKGSEIAANRYLAYLNIMLAWAVDRGIIESNPAEKIKPPGAETSRSRVLSQAEIAALWRATGAPGDLFGQALRFLLLTAQRRGEVLSLTWGEVSGDTWTLPAERSKNHREHLVPLSRQALAILAARKAEQDAVPLSLSLARVKERGELPGYVFTTSHRRPYSLPADRKAALDSILSFETPWTIHDLRRTAVTRMSEDLKILPHVLECVINHSGGFRSGVAGVYNRAIYLDERRDALQRWADHIEKLAETF